MLRNLTHPPAWNLVRNGFFLQMCSQMKGNAQTEMFEGDAWRDVAKPDKKDPFHQDSRAHGSYSAVLKLHSRTVVREFVMNGLLKLNYAYNYRNFDGIKVPATRRVAGFDENKRKIPELVLVATDIRERAF